MGSKILMILSYCLKDKKKILKIKNYFNIVEKIYKKKYFNNLNVKLI